MYQIILTLFLAFFISGCSTQKKSKITIAISPWPGYEPLVLGLEKGFYDDLNLHIIRFATPTESFRALRDGVVDIAAFTADEVLHYANMKNKPVMFLILDISNGGDAIIARENIKSLNDLKGKKIGIEASALGNYMIHRAMDFTDEVKVSDLKISPVDIGNHLEWYKKGLIDAVVTYEPSRSMLLKEGAHVIFDSKEIPNEIIDVLVTEEETLSLNQEKLKKLADGWFKTIEYIKNNKKEAIAKMASYEYISADEFEKAYDELIIPTKSENIDMLGSTQKSYKTSLDRIAKLMHESGTFDESITTDNLLTNSVIKSQE